MLPRLIRRVPPRPVQVVAGRVTGSVAERFVGFFARTNLTVRVVWFIQMQLMPIWELLHLPCARFDLLRTGCRWVLSERVRRRLGSLDWYRAVVWPVSKRLRRRRGNRRGCRRGLLRAARSILAPFLAKARAGITSRRSIRTVPNLASTELTISAPYKKPCRPL